MFEKKSNEGITMKQLQNLYKKDKKKGWDKPTITQIITLIIAIISLIISLLRLLMQ